MRSASGRTEAAGARARPWRLASHCPKACRRALARVARHPAARKRQLRRPSPLARFCDAVRPHKSQSPVAAAKGAVLIPRLPAAEQVHNGRRAEEATSVASARALLAKVQWSVGSVRVVVARARARPPGLSDTDSGGWAESGVFRACWRSCSRGLVRTRCCSVINDGLVL